MTWPPKPLAANIIGLKLDRIPSAAATTGGGPHAITHSVDASDTINVEHLGSGLDGVVTVTGSGVAIQSDNCRIFTSIYTGDGATSQVITLPGAVTTTTVKYLRIWQRQPTSGTSLHIWEATREINDDIAAGMGVQPSYQTAGLSSTGMSFALSDTIIALGTNGTFTVDDAGSDYHPNSNSIAYNFMALGS